MPIADVLRLLCAAEALLLVPLCIYSIATPIAGDQKVRFGALALIGVVVVAGQIEALGGPGNWRMPVLAVGLGLAVAGVVMFLAHGRQARPDVDTSGQRRARSEDG